MTGDDYDLLVSRWLSGEASDADQAALAEQLKSDEKARLRFAELADQEAALRIVSESMVHARRIREDASVGPGTDTTRRIRTVRRRWKQASNGSWSASWIAGAAAAALFLAVILFGSTFSSKPAAGTRRPPAPIVWVPPASPPAPRPKPVDERIADLSRERERLQKTEPLPTPNPDAEKKRLEALEQLNKDWLRLQEEKKRAPEPPPAEPAPKQEPAATVTAAATLEDVRGEAYVLSPAGRVPAYAGLRILPGDGLETVGARSSAKFAFADKTVAALMEDGSAPEIYDLEAAKGKRVRLLRGTLAAIVSKQPVERPFLIPTPHGEARVLGTALRIVVGADSTRLEVTEGKVRLTSAQLNRTVDVIAGHFAVAATGVEMVARPLPINEIVLLPSHGRLYGVEWRRSKDPLTASGVGLDVPFRLSAAECEARFKRNNLGYVGYTFQADADRDYALWIRGRCLVDSPDVKQRFNADMVAVQIPDAQVLTKTLPDCLSNNAYGYTGWGHRPGYWWISGDADPDTDGAPRDKVPVMFRFNRPGRQVMRVYIYEAPTRIDVVWLSATQKERPADDQRGPQPAKE